MIPERAQHHLAPEHARADGRRRRGRFEPRQADGCPLGVRNTFAQHVRRHDQERQYDDVTPDVHAAHEARIVPGRGSVCLEFDHSRAGRHALRDGNASYGEAIGKDLPPCAGAPYD